LKKSKQVKIDPDEAKYLNEVLFIDIIHLQQSEEDVAIPKRLLKKIKAD